MDRESYTNFPSLQASIPTADAAQTVVRESFQLLAASEDVYLVAWARLLQAYTGQKRVVFLSNNEQIIFGDEDDAQVIPSIHRRGLHGLQDSGSCNATGLFFEEDGPSSLQLRLLVQQEERQGTLFTTDHVPQQHLKVLKGQYLALLDQARLVAPSPSSEGDTLPLSILNHPPQILTGPRLLHELIGQSLDESRLAIEHLQSDGKRIPISYGVLRSKARLVAAAIRARLGADHGPRVIVPVLLSQGPSLYWTLIGILQAACAFCPLNLDAPAERIRFVAEDVAAPVIITETALVNSLPDLGDVHIVCVDTLNESEPLDSLMWTSEPSDAAYVMYTSGSTGTPKGVELSHLAVTQSLQAHEPYIPKYSRFLQFAAPTFDVSMFEIFFTLMRGATIVSCDRQHLLNNLPAVINTMEIDAAELTPTVAGSLLLGRESVPGLKVLLTIGEMLTERVIREYGNGSSGRGILHGMYGPTEAAIHCTLEANFDADLRPGIVGRPLATVSSFVVSPSSDNMQENLPEILPIGFVGELAIGGPQLATGYLSRPEQNQKSYVAHPQYGRLYRTGDKARILPDGRIECLGRLGEGQVKLRGQRIELGEIEHTALQESACKLAIAQVIDGSLVLFCAGEDSVLSSKLILDRCRDVLPKFMVPSDVRTLSTVPKLPSGKVDKRKLEDDYRLSLQAADDGSGHREQSPENELSVAISQHAGRTVRPLTNLSESGIDSLRAIQIASKLRKSGWEVSATDILTSRNVAQLSSLAGERKREAADLEAMSRSRELAAQIEAAATSCLSSSHAASDVDKIFPCTPIQLSMLAETAVRPAAYFNTFTFEVMHPSTDYVRSCLEDLVVANPMLRSGFCELENAQEPYALIVWKSLEPWQISTDEYAAKNARNLLRPFSICLTQQVDRIYAVFNIHHAMYDGWSVDLLLEDLALRLQTKAPPYRQSYGEVCTSWVSRGQSYPQADRTFWERQMQNFAIQPFPNLHGRTVQDEGMHTCSRNLSASRQDLQTRAEQTGVSKQSFAATALAYLLTSYLGSNDVTFATVTSGRTSSVTGIEHIVGPCLATLPLRLSIDQKRSAAEMLRQTHRHSRSIVKHDSVPLGDIKRICGVPAGTLLCDVLFVWQETLLDHAEYYDTVRMVDNNDDLEFRLVIEVEPRENTIGVKLRYSQHLLPHEHAQLLLQQFDQVINGLLHHPDTPVQSLSSYLKPDTLSIENADPVSHTFTKSLTSAVESHALSRPNEAAVAFYHDLGLGEEGAEVLTYSQLDSRANTVARQLVASGVAPDDLVVICLEKTPLFYIAVLAVLKAGAGYVPVTPVTPRDRIAVILSDSNPRLCLTSTSTSENWPSENDFRTLNVESISSDTTSASLALPYVGHHAAYAVYTSGSTGTPKGLLVTQDNLQSNLKELADLYPNRPKDRLLQSCSQAFDVSVFEIFFTWQQAMCLCSAANDDLFRDLEYAVRSMQITHLSLTPTVAALIDPDNVPEVQFLVTAGEAVTEQVFRRWTRKKLLWHGYGPAETVNICTVNGCVGPDASINNIGRPFKNTSTLVLHPDTLDKVPRGGVGELCFGGDQVCRGYINRAGLTAEKFVQHPEFGRVYRSGDLGRLLDDGSILFVGRADDQVKLRGQRIELGEINSLVMDHAFVEDCTSLVIGGTQDRAAALVVFWVPQASEISDGANVNSDLHRSGLRAELFSTMRARLPTYMIPSNLIQLHALPRTVQGKIDKRQLRDNFESLGIEGLRETSDAACKADDSGAMSEGEASIAEAMSQVLQIRVSDIHRHSAFFSLGLDSLSAIRLSRVLRSKFGYAVNVSTILKHPSISELARVLSVEKQQTRADHAPAGNSTRMLPTGVVERVQDFLSSKTIGWQELLPCTPLQTSMLSAASSSNTAAYCNYTSYKLVPDPTLFKAAFRGVLGRHSIFRTAFVPTSDTREPFVQAVLSESQISLYENDLGANLSQIDIRQKLQQQVTDRLSTSQPPYVVYFESRDDEDYVHMLLHHSLYDGIAMSLLFDEVECLCRHESLSAPRQFGPFLQEVCRQQSEEAVHFWTDYLDDYLPIEFPVSQGLDRSDKRFVDYFKASTEASFDLRALEAGCRRLNITLSAAVLCGWAKVLSLYVGTTEVCFGKIVSGRHSSIDGTDHLVAPCFNTIPVRADLSGTTNLGLLEVLQQANANSLPYSLTSLRKIQNALDLAGCPLFESIVLLQETAREPDSTLWELTADEGTMDFPVILEVTPNIRSDCLELVLHYANNILQPVDAQSLVAMFSAALIDCIEFPEADPRIVALHDHAAATLRKSDLSQSPLRSMATPSRVPRGNSSGAQELLFQAWKRNGQADALLKQSMDTRDNSDVVIVDIAGNILPIGFVGELSLRKRVDVTAGDTDTEPSLSRSGVLACFSSREEITVLSVTDAVISSAVSAIQEISGIADATLCRSGRRSDPLAVYVDVKDPKEHGLEKEILQLLESFLPSSLMPNQVSVVNSIPYTKEGRIHVKRLAAEAVAHEQDASVQKSTVWPTTAKFVREVYEKVSGRDPNVIGLDTSIFRLGIDSIGAIQVATLLRQKYTSVTATDILEHPTCSRLAQYLEAHPQHVNDQDASSRARLETFEKRFRSTLLDNYDLNESIVSRVLPCTSMQSGLLASSLRAAGTVYINHICYDFPLGTSEDSIINAWAATVRAHQMLRTGFGQIDTVEHPFAMICYDTELPVDKFIAREYAPLEQWRKTSLGHMATNLHEPQWRGRIVPESNALLFHVLIHHAIYDARSLEIINTTFRAAFDGVSLEQKQSILTAVSLIMDAGAGQVQEHESFWATECVDMSIQKFPNMSPLAIHSTTWDHSELKMSLTLSQLENACAAADATIQAASQAAYGILLAAYTGEHSVTFGVVLSGRETESDNATCFPHVVTVPFSCNISGGKEAILQRALHYGACVRRHMFLPLTAIQRVAGYPNQSLFDTVFAYQRPSPGNGTHLQHRDVNSVTEYPVSLELEASDGRDLLLRLSHSTAVLPSQQARLLLRQFNAILYDLLDISESTAQSPTVHDPSLISFKPADTPTIPSPVKLLHEWVEWQAMRNPDRPALELASSIERGSTHRQRWTYAELNERSDLVAHRLQKRGIRARSKIGICFDKCAEASFATIGILKAGCVFVAIDPRAPPDRNAFVLEDSGSKVVLSHGSIATEISGVTSLEVLDLQNPGFWREDNFEPNTVHITPDDVCYCLYTSGTTGTPKGCEITHENVIQALQSFQRLFDGHWNDDSRWLQFASFHFDVSVLEQFWSWAVGICVVTAPRDVIFEDLPRAIRELGITHIDLTPSLAKLITPNEVPGLCKGVFITGGEKLQQDVLDTWGPERVIYNGYGPTEATIGVTMYPRVPENGKPSNIGWQFDNVGTVVLAPGTDSPVLRGAVGELCVTGKLVGKGYLNRPDLTSKRFPVLSEWGGRAYRTGDLVRMLHDDGFDFVGRVDDQVKLRGQRLEIGEINHTIKAAVPAVRDLATLVLAHPAHKTEQLVCFVSTAEAKARSEAVKVSTTRTTLESIERAADACRSKLPPYMVPSQFIGLNKLPLSANNKIDTNALKALYSTTRPNAPTQASHSTDGKEHFLTRDEGKVAKTVVEFLNLASTTDILPFSNLYELGLDSITVLGLSKNLRDAGHARATVSILTQFPTIRGLANALKSGSTSDKQRQVAEHAAKQQIRSVNRKYMSSVCTALDVEASDVEYLAPCTPLQEGIISRALESSGSQYYVAFYFELPQEISMQRLQQAWANVHHAVPILRAQFLPTDDGYLQVVRRSVPLPWVTSPLHNITESDFSFRTAYETWIQANTDLIRRPFEIVLFDRDGTNIMALHLFHALYDATSLDLLLKAVAKVYNGQDVIHDSSFFDCLPHGPLLKAPKASDFWRYYMKEFVPATLSTISQGPEKITRSILVEDLFNLTARRLELSVTKQALLQACWTACLTALWKGSSTTGLITSGRSLDVAGIENVIGPLFNTIPFAIELQRRDTWRDLIARCHDFNRAVLPFQHTALRDIRRWLRLDAGQSLFDNILVFQRHEAAEDIKFPWTLMHSYQDADYPLACEIEEIERDALRITLVASPAHAHDDEVDLILDTFKQCVHAVLDNPDALIGETVDIHNADVEGRGRERKQNGHLEVFTNGEPAAKDPVVNLVMQEVATLSGIDTATIRREQSILELGLDSIDAIKLSSRLTRKLQRITVSQIMKAPTIERISQNLRSVQSESQANNATGLLETQSRVLHDLLTERYSAKGRSLRFLPSSPLQDAMVSAMQASSLTKYFNHDVLRLESGTDGNRLLEAISTVVAENPILRTTFTAVDHPEYPGAFAQVVHPPGVLSWRRNSTKPADSVDRAIEDTRTALLDGSDRSSLFSASIVTGQDCRYLLLSVAHALYDGWSLTLLHQDIRRAYGGHAVHRISYDDTLADIITIATNETSAEFWRSQLQDTGPSLLPARTDHSAESNTVHRLEQNSTFTAKEVKAFCKRHAVTSQSLLTTCWGTFLAHRLHKLDVVFGVVLSGRDSPEANEVMFPTMNTVAYRCYISGTASDLVRQTQEDMASIREHQHYPLAKAKMFTRSGDQALFNTLFINQARPEQETGLNESLYHSEESISTVDVPVCVEAEVQGDALIWRIACANNIFDRVAAQKLLQDLDSVLQHLLSDVDTDVIEAVEEGFSIAGLPAIDLDEVDINSTIDADLEDQDKIENELPLTQTERSVSTVMSSIARVPLATITNQTTLYHVGLDSISAIKVSRSLREQNLKISVTDLMRLASVKRISEHLDTAGDSHPHEANGNTIAPNIVRPSLTQQQSKAISELGGYDEQAVLTVQPVSAGQCYMLTTWLASSGALFFPEFEYVLQSKPEHRQLAEAWSALCQENPMLRTAFVATKFEGTPFAAIVLKEPSPATLTLASTEPTLAFTQPFARLAAEHKGSKWYLKLKIHHALYDGVTLPGLFNRLEALCRARSARKEHADTSALTTLASICAPDRSAQAFWKSYLAEVSHASLGKLSWSDRRVETFKPQVVDDLGTIRKACSAIGISIHAAFLASYAKLYASITQRPDTSCNAVLIGVYLANRSHGDGEFQATPAPTVNLLPLLVRQPTKRRLAEIAKDIQYDLQQIGRFEHCFTSLWQIYSWTGLRVDTFVNFLDLPDNSDEHTDGKNIGSSPTQSLTGKWQQAYSNLVDPPDHSHWEAPSELTGCPQDVMDAYVPSLDIEAAVVDGGLAVGIFGPEAAIGGEQGAHDMMDNIRTLVDTFSDRSQEIRIRS